MAGESFITNEAAITAFKVSLAGLFHDIGKFAQNCLTLPPGYEQQNADLYQPFNKKEGRHTHIHVLYTAAFIETLRDKLPKELNDRGWGEGEVEDCFLNLAAKHHKPETPLQWIITQADRLSSGFDRVEFEKGEKLGVHEATQTRLLPIFERLLRTDKTFDTREDFDWRYPLEPLSAQSIFPVKSGEFSEDPAQKDYQTLFDAFCKDLEKLCHRKHVTLWAQHFDSLYRIYASPIPAARVGMVIHDVSLYDHSRATAALAGALYLYHRLNDSLTEEAIKNDSPKKVLLISGDFHGIQDFIFRGGGEERHHRAKLLRGRSFLVSLLMELAAEIVCERLNLSFLSVVLSAAGKFHIIAPNHAEIVERIHEVHKEINDWLREKFYGECSLGFALTEASPLEFAGGLFRSLWQRHLEHLEEAKFKRFKAKDLGVFKGYLDSFRNDLPRPLCPLCGKRPSDPTVMDDPYISRGEPGACACKLCRDQAWLGTQLVKKERLAVLKRQQGKLKEPLFGRYQLDFLSGCAGSLADEGALIKLFDLNVRNDGSAPVGATFLPINGYVPVFTEEDRYDNRYLVGRRKEESKLSLIDQIELGNPKTFYHLAQLALEEGREKERSVFYGLPVLGVLKADVDNLGAIFACGIPEKLFTLSRLVTMSRQLNNFFTLYLPYALEHEGKKTFRNIYTVFAGGDDLFLIGPWNVMADFALFLQQKFKNYTCENPEIHLSAGITLHKPHIPVDLLAFQSEEALKAAKGAGRNRICMFDQVVTWGDFGSLNNEVRRKLTTWYEQNLLSRRGLYRLNELCAMADEEARLLIHGDIPVYKLQCLKWRAFLRYFLTRSLSQRLGNQWRQIYDELSLTIFQWLSEYKGRFILALWPLLYRTKKQFL